MLLSFLPVFALGGHGGEDVPPAGADQDAARWPPSAVLAITLVPALCTVLIRGRLRGETDSPLVRGVIEVYRPVLDYLLDRPGAAGLGPRRDVRRSALRADRHPAGSSWRRWSSDWSPSA